MPLMELRFSKVPAKSELAFLSDMVDIVSQNSSWLRYMTPEPASVNPVVIQKLADARVPVYSLSEVPQSLEKVYLRVLEEDTDGTN